MKYFIIILLSIGTLKAQDSAVNRAGNAFKQSKTFELLAITFATAGTYCYLKEEKQVATGAFVLAGLCEIAAISYHFKGCELMVKANGVRIKF